MKSNLKSLLILAAATMLASCGNSQPASSSQASSSAAPASSQVSSSSGKTSSSSAQDTGCSNTGTYSSQAAATEYVQGAWSVEDKILFNTNFGDEYINHVYGFAAAHSSEYSSKYGCVSIEITKGSKEYLDSYAAFLSGKGYTVTLDDESTAYSSYYYASKTFIDDEVEYAVTSQLYNMGSVVYCDFYLHVGTIADMSDWEADAKTMFNESFYDGAYAEFPTYQKDAMTCTNAYLADYGCLILIDKNMTSSDLEALKTKILAAGYQWLEKDDNGDDWGHYSKVTDKGEHVIDLVVTGMLNFYYYCYFWQAE